jgi:hypothetical protein
MHSVFCILHFAFCIHDCLLPRRRKSPNITHARQRTGGVYIAVLGTSLIVALLGMTALMTQRIQNRMLSASADIRQAQLNANTAVELALLTMKQDPNWRVTQPNGRWFTGRDTAAGTCSLDVTDPVDANLANTPDDPVLVRGIGSSGQAEQRVEVTVDPRKQPLSCLRSAVAAGDLIDLNSDTLRTTGLITANQVTASSSQVYGNVEAAAISGSTYNGTTTQINAAKLPTMPDWSTVFNYYRDEGIATKLDINLLSQTTPNLGRNVGIENGASDWTGSPPGIPTAQVSQSNNQARTGSYSLRVQNRSSWIAGAAQSVDAFVEPNSQYIVEAWVYLPLLLNITKNFRITLYTKGTLGVQADAGPDTAVLALGWRQLSATLTAPSWSGNLEYAFIKIAGADSGNTADFYLDDLVIREALTGRLIYRKVLGPGPGQNTLYSGAPTNAQGIYWIDCGGNRLVISRSRILGTLLVINPGPNSCVASGPISWSPAVPGYPALLVDADNAVEADFGIYATNRVLSETENGVDYNLDGTTGNYIYPSEIRGLIAIRDDLTYSNRPLIRGQILVGDDIKDSSGELEVEFLPDSLLNPPPGFLAPYSYLRRPASARKVVLP